MATSAARAKQVFRDHGGTLRTHEVLTAGIHPRTIYSMRDAGELQVLARGVYRLANLPPLGELDLVTVAPRSRLSDLSTRIPRAHDADPTRSASGAVANTPTTAARLPTTPHLSFFDNGLHGWHRNAHDRRGADPCIRSREDHRRLLRVSQQDRPRCRGGESATVSQSQRL